jgi:hypothetical protein
MRVNEFFEYAASQGGTETAAWAGYADPSDGGADLRDVYYAPGGIRAEIILHETLHYFLGVGDTELANRLGIPEATISEQGTRAISWALRDAGCR